MRRSVDDLRGLRAARWIRESTTGQYDRYGPDSQREQQDAFLERFGLVDTGLVFQVAESGRTVWRSAGMERMLQSAEQGRFDVLVAGYFDRWQRNVRRTIELIEDRLHPAGVAWAMADRRLLSSDPRDWREMRRLANEAQEYSEKLGERITDGYAAKFKHRHDQGGLAPLGFRRDDARLSIDPSAIGRAVEVFERYSTGMVSHTDLASLTGLRPDAIREMLRAPIYNGWVRRHRRGIDEERLPAAWRDAPPVSDELWARVQEVRTRRYNGGGHPHPRHIHLLSRKLVCACGTRLRAETKNGPYPQRRYVHPDPCQAFPTRTRPAHVFEGPICAQVSQTKPGAKWLTQLRAFVASERPRPDAVALRKRQLERELSDKALALGRRHMDPATFMAEHARISALIDSLQQPTDDLIVPEEAWQYVTDLQRAWRSAGEDEDGQRAKRDLIAAIYDRIIVTAEGFVGVHLTPNASRHGLTTAMPERVVSARRAGFEPSLTTLIPVVGRSSWRVRAVRSA